jgi:hypothetical protein
MKQEEGNIQKRDGNIPEDREDELNRIKQMHEVFFHLSCYGEKCLCLFLREKRINKSINQTTGYTFWTVVCYHDSNNILCSVFCSAPYVTIGNA